MDVSMQGLEPLSRTGGGENSPGRVVRLMTGCAFLVAAAGIFFDAYTCGGCSQGSIGLIPLYIGFPIGSIGFVVVIRRAQGWMPALLAAAGLAGIQYFMFTYPNGSDGWIGAILVGMASLFFPLSGRFLSVLWVAVGLLGFPKFGQHAWGVLNAYSLLGAATGSSGAYVLWVLKSQNPPALSQVNLSRTGGR